MKNYEKLALGIGAVVALGGLLAVFQDVYIGVETLSMYRDLKIIPQSLQKEAYEILLEHSELLEERLLLQKQDASIIKKAELDGKTQQQIKAKINSFKKNPKVTSFNKRKQTYDTRVLTFQEKIVRTFERENQDLRNRYSKSLRRSADYKAYGGYYKPSLLSKTFGLTKRSVYETLFSTDELEEGTTTSHSPLRKQSRLLSRVQTPLKVQEEQPLLAKTPTTPATPATPTEAEMVPATVQNQGEGLQFRGNRTKVKTRGVADERRGGAAVAHAPEVLGQEAPLHAQEVSYEIFDRDAKAMFEEMQNKHFRNVSSETVARFLKKEGFEIDSIRGSHIKFHKSVGDFTVIVPKNDCLPIGTLKDGILGKNGLRIVAAMA